MTRPPRLPSPAGKGELLGEDASLPLDNVLCCAPAAALRPYEVLYGHFGPFYLDFLGLSDLLP